MTLPPEQFGGSFFCKIFNRLHSGRIDNKDKLSYNIIDTMCTVNLTILVRHTVLYSYLKDIDNYIAVTDHAAVYAINANTWQVSIVYPPNLTLYILY